MTIQWKSKKDHWTTSKDGIWWIIPVQDRESERFYRLVQRCPEIRVCGEFDTRREARGRAIRIDARDFIWDGKR